MQNFRKKPITIQAIQWNGKNLNEIRDFLQYHAKVVNRGIQIKTLEGVIYAKESDWVIKGIEGEFYPCDDKIFRATYDDVSI